MTLRPVARHYAAPCDEMTAYGQGRRLFAEVGVRFDEPWAIFIKKVNIIPCIFN
jgi:hypothetical protein